ncbi:unnamed protein product [Euphydryas editha]|uniref:FP protein C-terminal domain-containing protein n=1 Tax=Euphydryas editha TaxID=104508 RepID=A0AAU9TRK1_EUPED|nr:unnamed protein product [Euphydryas editha]
MSRHTRYELRRKCAKCNITALKDGNLSFHRFPLPGRHTLLKARVWAEYCYPTGEWSTEKSLRDLHSQHKMLCKDVTLSLERCHERLDELGVSVTKSESRIKVLEDNQKEVMDLKSTLSQMQSEMNIQAQSALRNEFELAGIPEKPNESLHHIVLLAARKVGVELEDRDIDSISRVGPRILSTSTSQVDAKLPRPVVVRLLRRLTRDQILKAAKSRRNITSADLEIPGNPLKVYFNERLTRENRILFREARIKAKEKGYAYCWTSQGSLFVRQREGKAAIPIRSREDLNRIFFHTT